MKLIRKKLKPSKALGRKGHRPVLQGGMIRAETVTVSAFPDKGNKVEEHLVLYCSNGYVFIRVDLGKKDPLDEPGPIPAAALKHLESGVNADLGLDFVRVGITRYERVLADAPYADVSGDKYPDFEKVMDQHWKEPRGSNRLSININPKLLLEAAQAIGSEGEVELVLDQRAFKEVDDRVMSKKEQKQHKGKRRLYYGKGIKLQPRQAVRDNKAYGLVMPMTPNTDELRDDL